MAKCLIYFITIGIPLGIILIYNQEQLLDRSVNEGRTAQCALGMTKNKIIAFSDVVVNYQR
jgi:hypothetical protein